jgi:hypothetical protein
MRCGLVIAGSPFIAAGALGDVTEADLVNLRRICEMGGGTACPACIAPAPSPTLKVAARLLDAAMSSLSVEERRAFVDDTRREYPEAFAEVERAALRRSR